MWEKIRSLWVNKKGQALVAYTLVLSLIAVASIGTLSLLGEALKDYFEDTAKCIEGTAHPGKGKGLIGKNKDCR